MRKSSDCFLGDRNSSSLPMACPPTPGCPNVSQPAMVGGSSNIFQPALPLQRLTLRCGQFSVPLPGSPAVRLGPRKKEGRTVIRKLKRKYQQQEMSQKSLSLSDLSGGFPQNHQNLRSTVINQRQSGFHDGFWGTETHHSML